MQLKNCLALPLVYLVAFGISPSPTVHGIYDLYPFQTHCFMLLATSALSLLSGHITPRHRTQPFTSDPLEATDQREY